MPHSPLSSQRVRGGKALCSHNFSFFYGVCVHAKKIIRRALALEVTITARQIHLPNAAAAAPNSKEPLTDVMLSFDVPRAFILPQKHVKLPAIR